MLQPDDFVLASDIRAAEREKFELLKREKDERKRADEAQQKREQKMRLLEEHRKFRKSLEFKARPYNPENKEAFVCVPSNVGLTVPVSPHFATKARGRE